MEAGVSKVIPGADVVSIKPPRGGSTPQAHSALGLHPAIGPFRLACAHGFGMSVVKQCRGIRLPAVVEVVRLTPAIGAAGVTRVALGPSGLEPMVFKHVCF